MIRSRKLNRLKDYDYARERFYFVTVCVKDRREWFGEIKDGRMIVNPYREIVSQCWESWIIRDYSWIQNIFIPQDQ